MKKGVNYGRVSQRFQPGTLPQAAQIGDIVVFGNDDHIAVCSDKRNENGIPLLLHHGGKDFLYPEEDDDIYNAPVTERFRWPG